MGKRRQNACVLGERVVKGWAIDMPWVKGSPNRLICIKDSKFMKNN